MNKKGAAVNMGPQNFNNRIKMTRVRNPVTLTGLNNLKQLDRIGKDWKDIKRSYLSFLGGRSIRDISSFSDRMRVGLFDKDVGNITSILNTMLETNQIENKRVSTHLGSTLQFKLTTLGEIRRGQIMEVFIDIATQWHTIGPDALRNKI